MRSPSPEQRAALVGGLAQWLDAQRVELLKGWADQGLSPTVEVDRPIAQRSYERVAERQARWYLNFSHTKVSVPRIRLMTGVSMMWRSEKQPPPVELFAETYGNDSVAAGVLDAIARPEVGTAEAFLGRMAGDFLNRLEDFDRPDADLAASVIEGYLTFIASEYVTKVVQIPIGGISAPSEPLELSDVGVNVRALSPEELGELNREMFGLQSLFCEGGAVLPAGMRFRQDGVGLESSMLTISERVPRDDSGPPSWRAARILLALQLLGRPMSGRGVIASWTEPGPRMGLIDTPPVLPNFPAGPENELTADELRRAAVLADRIPVGCFDKPAKRDEVALRRFLIADAQEDDAEAIIDYVIALEGLLVPTSQGESVYRFCLNGARYIAHDSGDRPEIFKDLKGLYDIRSKLVHGSGVRSTEQKRDAKRKARQLASRALLKAIVNGWPTPEDFISAALS